MIKNWCKKVGLDSKRIGTHTFGALINLSPVRPKNFILVSINHLNKGAFWFVT